MGSCVSKGYDSDSDGGPKNPLPKPTGQAPGSSPYIPMQPAKPAALKKVKALFDFEAETEDELSFRAEDILFVISEAENGWYLAQHSHSDRSG